MRTTQTTKPKTNLRVSRNNKFETSENDKAIMFFSASSYKDALCLLENGIYDILTSYHYINKNRKGFEDHILPEIKKHNGTFMTDSGAFTFFAKPTPEMYNAEYWDDYIVGYCDFLKENAEYIYCAANMDIDVFVGQDVVDMWNKKYFEPLHSYIRMIYIIHGDRINIRSDDPYAFKRFKDYASKYKYIGLGSAMFVKNVRLDNKFYQLAKQFNVHVHGFGWTSIPSLKEFPFFSVDSTTWLGGVRYGTTYKYDGANSMVLDHKNKFRRKQMKALCRELGLNYANLLAEKRDEINAINLYGWKGFRREFLKAANTKLTTGKARSFKVIKYKK